MKKINHNIRPSLKTTIVFCIVCAMMVAIGKRQLSMQKKLEQSKIDSAIYYVDFHSDLGDAMDIRYYINEASVIYDLDSSQVMLVRNEYYLD